MRMNKLDTYLSGRDASKFAADVGITAQYLSNLRKARRRPSLPLALRIQAASDGAVSVTDWPEEVQREPLRRAL